jgi:hypothetical protein
MGMRVDQAGKDFFTLGVYRGLDLGRPGERAGTAHPGHLSRHDRDIGLDKTSGRPNLSVFYQQVYFFHVFSISEKKWVENSLYDSGASVSTGRRQKLVFPPSKA